MEYGRRMWGQEIHRVLKFQQISINIIHMPHPDMLEFELFIS